MALLALASKRETREPEQWPLPIPSERRRTTTFNIGSVSINRTMTFSSKAVCQSVCTIKSPYDSIHMA
jgi:hypothetical protein